MDPERSGEVGHMWPWNTRHGQFWGLTTLGVVVALFTLGLAPGWGLTFQIAVVGNSVIAIVFLCSLGWQLATGRIGLLSWHPTARRQGRFERRAAARARADALVQQQRLGEAMSHGSYSPRSAPPASGERTRARQELLDAIEHHGGLSPQARAAAEKVKRARG
jgi:hypothetical protein